MSETLLLYTTTRKIRYVPDKRKNLNFLWQLKFNVFALSEIGFSIVHQNTIFGKPGSESFEFHLKNEKNHLIFKWFSVVNLRK